MIQLDKVTRSQVGWASVPTRMPNLAIAKKSVATLYLPQLWRTSWIL